MNIKRVLAQLTKLYPGKNIVVNSPEFPLEVICELDETNQTRAVGIIDFIRPHYHKVNTEVYEVTKGELIIYLKGKTTLLKKGERIKIKPYAVHSGVGKETCINVYSNPGWKLSDHIMVKNIQD